MKNLKIPSFRAMDLVVILATVSLVTVGLAYRAATKADVPCTKIEVNHPIYLANDAVNIKSIIVPQCDTITIVNQDQALSYRMAFGVHASHIEYPGYEVQDLAPGESIRVDMIEAGAFLMHDHNRDAAQIQISVTPQR